MPSAAYRKLVDTTQRKAVFEIEVGQAVICPKIIWVLDVEPRLAGGRITARSFIKALAVGIRAQEKRVLPCSRFSAESCNPL